MAIKTKDELMTELQGVIGESTEDNALTLLEDIRDTLDSFSSENQEDWKKKYEENDANWKKKYRDRFFSGSDDEEFPPDEVEGAKKLDFENLFRIGE